MAVQMRCNCVMRSGSGGGIGGGGGGVGRNLALEAISLSCRCSAVMPSAATSAAAGRASRDAANRCRTAATPATPSDRPHTERECARHARRQVLALPARRQLAMTLRADPAQRLVEIALDLLQRGDAARRGAVHALEAERQAGVLQFEHVG